jgi:ankyrin repeat protein
LVKTLIHEHKADVNALDDKHNTPLHVAALNGKVEVALSLITDFGCNPNVKGGLGRTMLHTACDGGSVSLVKTLIYEHKADVNALDDQHNTPLHVAVLCGKVEVALYLITDFGCNPNVKGGLGRTLLHKACFGGSVSLVKTLIRDYKADVNALDDKQNTPLHVAALCGKVEVVLSLITDFHCDLGVTNQSGDSVLHSACARGSAELVEVLINKHFPSCVLSVNYAGDTPLHVCAENGHAHCVKALLLANAPPFMRNKFAETPVDVAVGRALAVLKQSLLTNKRSIQVDYNAVLELAKKRYVGEYPRTRLFMLGYPGAGKSSFVEAFKTEGGFFRYYWGISESSVTPHTAGIIPSMYITKQHVRVLLYDFAGDPEYYSSHAAILENLASAKIGDNLIIIVVDLSMSNNDTSIKATLQYWVTFIGYQKFTTKPFFALVGSHSDKLTDQQSERRKKLLEEFARSISDAQCYMYMMDCRIPRDMTTFHSQISSRTRHSPLCKLSTEASLLLGLLEKDFGNVTACTFQTILSHIQDSGVCLSSDAGVLYQTLSELHDIGILLLLGDHIKADCHVVLNISGLTNEVHKLLFSESAAQSLKNTSFNVGLLPESALKDKLPPNITLQCLSCLQYCQEIKCGDIGVFEPEMHPNQSFYFFPALCKRDKSGVSWDTSPDTSYSIGWLAQCTDLQDHFPPRFLHVLLLRLIFRFTLTTSTTACASFNVSSLQRQCTMWKTGVHWMMGEGVECEVELMNGNKQVAIITKADRALRENCVSVFHRILSCVMEAKADFCHSIRLDFYLLRSTKETDYHNEGNLFAMRYIERALSRGDEVAVGEKGSL